MTITKEAKGTRVLRVPHGTGLDARTCGKSLLSPRPSRPATNPEAPPGYHQRRPRPTDHPRPACRATTPTHTTPATAAATALGHRTTTPPTPPVGPGSRRWVRRRKTRPPPARPATPLPPCCRSSNTAEAAVLVDRGGTGPSYRQSTPPHAPAPATAPGRRTGAAAPTRPARTATNPTDTTPATNLQPRPAPGHQVSKPPTPTSPHGDQPHRHHPRHHQQPATSTGLWVLGQKPSQIFLHKWCYWVAWNSFWAVARPRSSKASTASAARSIISGSSLRSAAVKSRSRKSAGSWRPGGRPTPTLTR